MRISVEKQEAFNKGFGLIGLKYGLGDILGGICGSSSDYFTDFTSGDNIDEIFARDEVCTGYTDGFSSILKGNAGAGAGALRAFHGASFAEDGSQFGELYGADFYAIQEDGSQVDACLYGVIGYAQVDTGATVGNTYYQGILGVLDSDVSLAGTKIAGAVTACVKYAAAAQTFDGAFVAFRDGGGAGGVDGAAFKVRALVSDTIPAFNYGLDLYTEHTEGYGVADIRFQAQTIMSAGAGAPVHNALKGSMYIRTDGASADELLYLASADNTWQAVDLTLL